MSNHKLLTKLAIIMALLLGVGTFSANTNVQTVSAARTHHRKRTRTSRRKGKYIKDFCVYHVRKGVKGYTSYGFDTDDDDFKYELTDPFYFKAAKDYYGDTRVIVAPTSSHTKYELKTIDKNGKAVKARPFITCSNNALTGGHIPEQKFNKLFTKGGTFHMYDVDGPFFMKGHHLYGTTKLLYHNGFVKAITPEKLAKAYGYKNAKQKQEADILTEIQNEHLDASGKWADSYSGKETNDYEVARINKALKKLGYSDNLIDKIWKFQLYRLNYPDTHDDYDIPDLIDTNTLKSKFYLH